MKTQNARNETVVQEDDCVAQSSDAPGRDANSFARQLRALGQALEKFDFSAFDLEITRESYLVLGKATPIKHVKFSFSRFVSELLRGSSGRPSLTGTVRQVDLRFSPEDIERFDLRGKSRRHDSSKMPDPYSISQLLRGAGCYLDHRNVAGQVGISFEGRWVAVRYRTDEGRLEQTQQDLDYFYDYWVKMYLRRGNRAKLTPPGETNGSRDLATYPERLNIACADLSEAAMP
jgi:hypothetical protein